MEDGHTGEPIATHRHRLDRVAVLELGDERNHAIVRKVNEAHLIAAPANELLRGDIDRLRDPEHSAELVLRQQREEMISNAGSPGCSASVTDVVSG